MFCESCGVSCNATAKFFNSCGSSLKDGNINNNLPSNTSGFSTTMTFEEFLKRKASSNQSNDEEQTFKAIQKRKSNEQAKSIKKKDEIVKVCLMVINYYF